MITEGLALLSIDAATMLSTATPLTPIGTTSPTAFEWLSDVVLPTIVGLGSVGAAAVAIFFAARSNRIAREATAAAERSNEIADRANRLEEQRDQRAADADARLEREALRARWEAVLTSLARELQWGGTDEMASKTQRDGAQLITEGEVRELYPPHAAAMILLHRASEVGGGGILYMQASAAAHALMHDWVRAPARVDFAIAKWSAWMDERVKEHAEDVRRGLPT